MDNNPELNPQVPGQLPGVDPESLAPLLELAIADLVAGLSALTNDEIDVLLQTELLAENRENYVQALQTEQLRRIEDAVPPDADQPVPKPEDAPAPLGDVVGYAHVAAVDIDPTTLDRAVLSRDGWVLPHPKLNPE